MDAACSMKSRWMFPNVAVSQLHAYAVWSFSFICTTNPNILSNIQQTSYPAFSSLIANEKTWPIDMGVSENSGTPKSSTLIGFSILNHPFWGTPILGNIHIVPGSSTSNPMNGALVMASFTRQKSWKLLYLGDGEGEGRWRWYTCGIGMGVLFSVSNQYISIYVYIYIYIYIR